MQFFWPGLTWIRTLNPPNKVKKKKKNWIYRDWTQDHWIHKPKLTHWATKLRLKWMKKCKIKNHLIRSVHCWFLLRFLVPNISVLAIFSPFPPGSARLDPYRINFYLKTQLFSLYDMSVPECAHFQNQPFGSYLLNPCTNQNIFYGCQLHFVSYFIHLICLVILQPNLWEIFSLWTKFKFPAKILLWFLYFHIDIYT